MKLRWQVQNALRRTAEFFEDRWFDATHRVHTSGDVPLFKAGIAHADQHDSELYVPARPRHVREALCALPAPVLEHLAEYTYVDLGSGKGRTLFVAAELPFRQAIGVEFSAPLHEQAMTNIQAHRPLPCQSIDSLHQNAAEFSFPDGPLVVYMFNPFGAETMQRVLDRLEASLRMNPRSVAIVLLWPRCGDQVARMPGMQTTHLSRYIHIFANMVTPPEQGWQRGEETATMIADSPCPSSPNSSTARHR